jgi:hypothetical protein
MAFSQIERARLKTFLNTWVEEVPVRVRDELRHAYQIGSSDVVIFERRPRFEKPSEWHDSEVAKFRYVKAANEWRLYCQFRDLKWHAYEPLPSARTFEELFAEVRRDPTGIFWG